VYPTKRERNTTREREAGREEGIQEGARKLYSDKEAQQHRSTMMERARAKEREREKT
jgi:hypothetical protein